MACGADTCNSSTPQVEQEDQYKFKSTWSTQCLPYESELHRKTLSQETNHEQKAKMSWRKTQKAKG